MEYVRWGFLSRYTRWFELWEKKKILFMQLNNQKYVALQFYQSNFSNLIINLRRRIKQIGTFEIP